MPIYIICEYYIHRTDLADLWIFFASTITISFTFRIRTFTTWANKIPCVSLCLDKIPCVLTKFPNSLCFPWQGFLLAIFPVFPVLWVPCIIQILSNIPLLGAASEVNSCEERGLCDDLTEYRSVRRNKVDDPFGHAGLPEYFETDVGRQHRRVRGLP